MPGEQLYYFYGQRSNLFLFMNYGFAIEDNKYDSYQFHVNIDIENIKDTSFQRFYKGEPLFEQREKKKEQFRSGEKMLIQYSHIGLIRNLHYEKIRLKKGKLNEELMAYIRLYAQHEANQIQGCIKTGSQLKFTNSISTAQDRDFEL